MNIKDFMTTSHRECDRLLALAEDAVEKNNFIEASKKYAEFKAETLNHFSMEEDYLFLLLGERSGMGESGPISVMKMEHNQARILFDKLDEAIITSDAERFFALSESLMILLQQHNTKEEQILYTMMQAVLGSESDAIVVKLMSYGK